MALKWTKTSGPDSCVMNPKPLSPLNHLTVPVVIWTFPPFLARFEPTVRAAGRLDAAEGTARNSATHSALTHEASTLRRRPGRPEHPRGVDPQGGAVRFPTPGGVAGSEERS